MCSFARYVYIYIYTYIVITPHQLRFAFRVRARLLPSSTSRHTIAHRIIYFKCAQWECTHIYTHHINLIWCYVLHSETQLFTNHSTYRMVASQLLLYTSCILCGIHTANITHQVAIRWRHCWNQLKADYLDHIHQNVCWCMCGYFLLLQKVFSVYALIAA